MTLQVFSSYAFEIYNGSWVNVTSDVRHDLRPKWNRGIMSNRQADRVGQPGFLTFTLNNSISNSAGLAGYYSPGHANCWAGWTTGLAVRLSFGFDGVTRYKYYGHIKPDGIDVEPGIYGARTVAVTCGDFMWRAALHELKGMAFAQNQNIGQLVTLINANMPVAPLATSIATGVENFPTIFDMLGTRTTPLAEYIKGAMSEWGYIYVIGDKTGGETLVVENQTTRTSSVAVTSLSLPSAESEAIMDESGVTIQDELGVDILADAVQSASFDNTMVEGMVVSYGKNVANRVIDTAYPRRVDAAATTVLWALQKSFRVRAGETITGYVGAYRDPANPKTKVSGIDMQAMVSGTDYTATVNEDGTGGSMTASLVVTPDFTDTARVSFTLQNTHASTDLWIQVLQVKGKGVYVYETIQNVQDDTAAQAAQHGVIPLTLDHKYQADARKAATFASYVLSKEAYPRQAVDACPIWANSDSMRMAGFLQLEPGTKATFVETQSGVSHDYFINGYSAELYPGKDGMPYVLWTPVLKDDPGFYVFWIAGVARAGIDTAPGF